MDPLLKWRDEFPILKRHTYLINNSLGAMPRAVYDELKAFADKWATDGVEAWHDWLPMVTETADLIAKLIGAPPGTMIMHQNVSTLSSIIASCMDWTGKRNKIVDTDMNFTTVHYLWRAQERRGAKFHLVKTQDGIDVDVQQIVDAIDDTTAIVPLSHVLFRSGALQDVKPVIEKAHKVGALVCLDCYQSAGIVPVNAQALDVDFIVGGSVKWLCGGPGACYLYVRPDVTKRMEPTSTGWFSHKRPFAFELGPVDPADDIWRFMGGSPGVPSLYSARSGYKILAQVGIENIREKSMRQTKLILERALADGLTVNTPHDAKKRGGTVVVDFEGAEPASKELIKRGFYIDHRPKAGIRISPHFYNSDEECVAILDEIKTLRAGR